MSSFEWQLKNGFNIFCTFIYQLCKGAQWLSGRVLDVRWRGGGFQPHRHHCVVSLSLLSTGLTQEDPS